MAVSMKNRIQIKRFASSILLVVLFLITLAVAFAAYRYYNTIARGILGLGVYYLLYFFVRYSGMDLSGDKLLSAPNKAKYLISAFAGGLISFWATMQIIEMALFIWNK
jgi:hypothetical protein